MIETLAGSNRSKVRPVVVAAQSGPRNVREAFIHGVRDIMARHALALGRISQDEHDRIMAAQLVYGLGLAGGYRGITVYGTWRKGSATVDTVEIAAVAEEHYWQLACTTVHEFGHVIAGHGAGHAKEWADRSQDLGFAKRPEAAGMQYGRDSLTAGLSGAVDTLAMTLGGDRPAFRAALGIGQAIRITGRRGIAPRPCSAGIGTRGGVSRGTGSGSRMVLWLCQCERPAKVRAAAGSGLSATCDRCNSPLVAQDK